MQNKIFVGRFTEQDLINKKDRLAVEEVQKKTGYKYVYTKIIKKHLHVWVVSDETYMQAEWI